MKYSILLHLNVALFDSTSEKQLGLFLIVSLSESSSETCTVLSVYKRQYSKVHVTIQVNAVEKHCLTLGL